MIMDIHVKIGTNLQRKDISLKTILDSMEENGIDKAVLSSYPQCIQNKMVIDQIKYFPNRLFAFYVVNPWMDDISSLIGALHDGFIGFVLDPIAHGYPLDSPDLLYDLLYISEQCALPIWINTFSSFFSACSQVENLAKSYPNISFILGHMGFNYDASTACELAATYANIYLETSGSMAINLKRAHALCTPDKILFGSGFPDINYQNLAIANLQDVFDPSSFDVISGKNFEKLMKKVKICV